MCYHGTFGGSHRFLNTFLKNRILYFGVFNLLKYETSLNHVLPWECVNTSHRFLNAFPHQRTGTKGIKRDNYGPGMRNGIVRINKT